MHQRPSRTDPARDHADVMEDERPVIWQDISQLREGGIV
jgi:hypothetical protein